MERWDCQQGKSATEGERKEGPRRMIGGGNKLPVSGGNTSQGGEFRFRPLTLRRLLNPNERADPHGSL